MTKPLVLILPLAFAASAALAQTGLSFSIGADYSEGKYGTPTKSRQWIFPLTAKYD